MSAMRASGSTAAMACSKAAVLSRNSASLPVLWRSHVSDGWTAEVGVYRRNINSHFPALPASHLSIYQFGAAEITGSLEVIRYAAWHKEDKVNR